MDWDSPKEKLDRVRALNAAANPPPVAAAPHHQQDEVAPAIPPNNQQNANNQGVGGNNGVVPVVNAAAAAAAEEKKKKKKKAKESLPTLSLSAPVPHPNDNHSRKMATSNTSAPIKTGNANPSSDLSSSSTSNHPTSSVTSSGIGSFGSDHSESPSPPSSSVWNVPDSSLYRPRVNSLSSNASGSSGAFSGSSGSPPSPGAQFGSPMSSANSILAQSVFKFQRKNSNGADRIR